MRIRRTLLFVLVFITIFSVCLFLLNKAISPVYRQLSKSEIRPYVKRFTRRELPDSIENPRTLYHYYRGVEELFLSFKTNQEGCSNVLNIFDGQDVRKEEYHQEETEVWQWEVSRFSMTSFKREKIKEDIFDKNLLMQIEAENIPKDFGNIWYLGYESRISMYRVLVLEDQGNIYIYSVRETSQDKD